MKWTNGICNTLGITINNGESVKSGTSNYFFNTSHTFDQTKKITKIVTTVTKSEKYIAQIKFFSGEELLCRVGYSDEDVEIYGRRVVTFEIAADEQLIGAELYDDRDIFVGVTWLKIKMAN